MVMENEIDFKISIAFKGSKEEFEKVAEDIAKLQLNKSVAIETVPLPEKQPIEFDGISIGTWPSPEVVIRKPKPPKPLPGIQPIARLLNSKTQNKIIQGLPRVRIDGINGGIRNPHLHVKDEIVLLDKERFKEFVGNVARELSNRML
jgi:hypothetical protein